MAIFELKPASKSDGTFACAWFDDDACLWDDERLSSVAPLAATWQPPSLKLHRPEAGATSVLFNPNALAVSEGIRQELASFLGIEFLPVSIEGCGVFHLLHVTAAIELPHGSEARVAPAPSGNIVQIGAFPSSFVPTFRFFRVLQPVGSAAREKGGISTRSIYVDLAGARAVDSLTRGCLTTTPVPMTG